MKRRTFLRSLAAAPLAALVPFRYQQSLYFKGAVVSMTDALWHSADMCVICEAAWRYPRIPPHQEE